MSTTTKYELLQKLRKRYVKSSRHTKKLILDEFCSLCGYNRKYAIRLFNSDVGPHSIQNLSSRGRKKQYDDPRISEVLRFIWVKNNLPCSRRLKAILPLWLPFYNQQLLTQDIREKLLSISPATIDRLMRPQRARFAKLGLSTTKPGSLIKKQIPVKTSQWDETIPGFLEADTLAHCGNSIAGMFVYTLNTVDIASQWTEQRATWGKGERGVTTAIADIERALPFRLKGFDCDNGSEFLNWHLIRYLTHKRKKKVQFTRSRAYQKNDNAHIENKNWTHLRQYLGYQRFESQKLVPMLNDLYTTEWNWYFNFFNPSMKLMEKSRIGSKIKKVYDKPKTPYQRLMESEELDFQTKQRLTKQFESLNPVVIQKRMQNKIKAIIDIASQK
jgi:hypothetical protein